MKRKLNLESDHQYIAESLPAARGKPRNPGKGTGTAARPRRAASRGQAGPAVAALSPNCAAVRWAGGEDPLQGPPYPAWGSVPAPGAVPVTAASCAHSCHPAVSPCEAPSPALGATTQLTLAIECSCQSPAPGACSSLPGEDPSCPQKLDLGVPLGARGARWQRGGLGASRLRGWVPAAAECCLSSPAGRGEVSRGEVPLRNLAEPHHQALPGAAEQVARRRGGPQLGGRGAEGAEEANLRHHQRPGGHPAHHQEVQEQHPVAVRPRGRGGGRSEQWR